jgi:hypothetical protein
MVRYEDSDPCNSSTFHCSIFIINFVIPGYSKAGQGSGSFLLIFPPYYQGLSPRSLFNKYQFVSLFSPLQGLQYTIFEKGSAGTQRKADSSLLCHITYYLLTISGKFFPFGIKCIDNELTHSRVFFSVKYSPMNS